MTAKKKERVKPPTKDELKKASKALREGKSLGGRVMAEESVAVREGVAKRKPKKK